MVIIIHSRVSSPKASIGKLHAHKDYLGDTNHPDNQGLTLHPAKNYNCGPSTADFVAAIEENRAKFPSPDNGWEEVVCCMGDGCYHTADERESIEKIIIDGICPGSPAHTRWIEDPETGKGTLHVIFPTINPEGNPNLDRNKGRQLKCMQALDAQIAHMLNTSSDKPAKRKKTVKTALMVARERLSTRRNPQT